MIAVGVGLGVASGLLGLLEPAPPPPPQPARHREATSTLRFMDPPIGGPACRRLCLVLRSIFDYRPRQEHFSCSASASPAWGRGAGGSGRRKRNIIGKSAGAAAMRPLLFYARPIADSGIQKQRVTRRMLVRCWLRGLTLRAD